MAIIGHQPPRTKVNSGRQMQSIGGIEAQSNLHLTATEASRAIMSLPRERPRQPE